MADDFESLNRAYRAADFQFTALGKQFHLVIGDVSKAVDGLLSELGVRSGVFITAFNPGSQRLPRRANEARHSMLVTLLRERNLKGFPGAGVGSDWEPETSLFVGGASRPDALELGLVFGQNTVVFHEVDRPTELLWCHPDRLTGESAPSISGLLIWSVQQERRTCPLPYKWSRLYIRLDDRAKKENLPRPPVPLILAGWVFSKDEDKHIRFLEQLHWAGMHGCTNVAERFISRLAPDEWALWKDLG